MLTELEWRTGLTIPNSILFEATTIRQVAQVLSERRLPGPKAVVHVNASGTRQPLIFFHGHFHGFGNSAITLAKFLGPDQPIFIIAPHGAPHGARGETIPRSMEAMAKDRLSLILNELPNGPYRLSGKCLGGIVAFEVARMLVAAGKDVEMVVMVDPPTINARRSLQLLFSAMEWTRPIAGIAIERAMAWTWFRCAQLQKFWNYPWIKQRSAITRRLSAIKSKLRKTAPAGTDQVSSGPIVRDEFGVPILGLTFEDARTSRYAAAMSTYRPQPLAVRMTYISLDFGVGAWRRICPDLEVVRSPGTHEFPDMASIAEHLRERL